MESGRLSLLSAIDKGIVEIKRKELQPTKSKIHFNPLKAFNHACAIR